MTEEIAIRSITKEDVPELVDLSAQLGYPIQTTGLIPRLEKILEDPNYAIFGACGDKGKVVGFVQVFTVCTVESEMFAEIMGLVVDQHYRRKGVGKKLMEAAEAWAKDRGIDVVRLRSNTIRKEAHKFYQDIGYKILKTQYTFYKEL
jgi:ribosomal protein S18 acetylase RimI-like enzyme